MLSATILLKFYGLSFKKNIDDYLFLKTENEH